MLRRVNKPIGCVSCVGPYRTGKSLLLSRFLKSSKSFKLGPTLEGCTRGIWISTSAIVQPGSSPSTYTFLLDCEGTGDPLEGSETSNARIALTCILISSVFLYNNTGRPDRSSLQFLNYLTTIRQRIPIQLGSTGGPGPDGASLTSSTTISSSRRNFPAFLWVFRDFFLQLPVRRDTNKPYTLREYMLERVLVTQNRGARSDDADDAIIDSLLNDFRSFDVLSIGYPKRGDVPFSPDELSTLDDVPWEEFDDEFKAEVEQTIITCLGRTQPFRLGGDPSSEDDLGPVAHGPLFSSWCHRVVDLVNSNDIIPDIPDMQQTLMKNLAEEKVSEAVDAYVNQMEDYLDGCPVYNDDVAGKRDGMVIAADMVSEGLIKGEGVAEDKELERHSLGVLVELCKELKHLITSDKLLDESLDKLKKKCIKDEHGSILDQLKETNSKRSRESCEAIARRLYMSFRAIVRDDATKMSDKQFEAGAKTVEDKFRTIARGPAVQETADIFLKEQKDADKIFLQRVSSINALYQDTLQKKEELDKDVEQKNLMVSTLKRDLEEQKKMEEEHISELRDDMAAKLKKAEDDRAAELKKKQDEMEAAKKDAEKRLADEVAAREERLRKEEEAHEQEIQKLMKTADANMKKEIMAAEEKRRADQAKFRTEMETKLNEAESRMQEEVKAREARLKEEEDRHTKELQRVRTELNEKMEVQKKKYLQEIDELEKQCFNFKACSIM